MARSSLRRAVTGLMAMVSGFMAASVSAAQGGAPPYLRSFKLVTWYTQPLSTTSYVYPQSVFDNASVNSAGAVAFEAQVEGAQRNQAVFVSDAAGLHAIATGCGGPGGSGQAGSGCGDPTPVGGTFRGFFSGLAGPPSINKAGDVVFLADVENGSASRGLFLYRAASQQLVKVAAVGDPAPPASTLAAIGAGVLNDAGDVVFFGIRSSDFAELLTVFRWRAGQLTRLAGFLDAVEDGILEYVNGGGARTYADGTLVPDGAPALNERGQVAFRAQFSVGAAIHDSVVLAGAGPLAIWLKNGDPAPGGGVFQGPWSVALNDRGELAFLARVALPKGKLAGGWFFGVPGRWQKLLGWDDVVEKGKVIDLTPSRGATRPFDESRRLLASARVQRPDGTQSVQTLLSEPGRTRVLVREDQESPWGGLYGEVNPSSLRGCFGVVGVGQPDSSYPSAQVGFQLRRCGGRTGR